MNSIFCLRDGDFTKICYRFYPNSLISSSVPINKVLLQSDEEFIDCVVSDNKLLCLNPIGVLFIYYILKSKDEIKLFFNHKLQLPYNEKEYPKWIMQNKNIIYSGNSTSLLQIKIHGESDYGIKIHNMKAVYNNFFVHLNEICCINMRKCSDTNFQIVSSAISSNGTYYFIKSSDCSFILHFDNKAIKCKQIEHYNVIKIEEHDDIIYAVVKTGKGFYYSKINEIHGLITKSIVEIELDSPLLCSCIIDLSALKIETR